MMSFATFRSQSLGVHRDFRNKTKLSLWDSAKLLIIVDACFKNALILSTPTSHVGGEGGGKEKRIINLPAGCFGRNKFIQKSLFADVSPCLPVAQWLCSGAFSWRNPNNVARSRPQQCHTRRHPVCRTLGRICISARRHCPNRLGLWHGSNDFHIT